MIRNARPEDSPHITDIWRICFGDSREYIGLFLNNAFSPERCLVWEGNGTPVAMLHLLFADCRTNGRKCKAAYIYAAATLPGFRQRGIMAALIAQAGRQCEQSGYAFMFLLPGSRELYKFYEKLGYAALLRVKKVEYDRNALSRISAGHAVYIQHDWKNDTLYKERAHFFDGGLLWKQPEFDYVLKEWLFTGGDILAYDSGYVFSRKERGSVLVKEVCGPYGDAAAALLSRYGSESFSLLLPVNSSLPGGRVENYGMIKPCGFELPDGFSPYTNLMLD